MTDEARQPGAAPGADQVSGSEGSNTTSGEAGGKLSDSNGYTGPHSKELEKTRAEAASYRVRLRELEAKLEAQAAEQAKAEEEKLAQKEQWKTLAEKREGELAKLKADHAKTLGAAHQHLIQSHAARLLAGSGITDPAQQALLMPGILQQANAKVGDDFTVAGDFDASITAAVELLGVKKADEEKPRKSARELSILTGQVPSRHTEQTTKPPSDTRSRLGHRLIEAASGGRG